MSKYKSMILALTCVVNKQALAEYGFAPAAPIQDAAANESEGVPAQSQHTMTKLICGKILSARCVQQQIKLMKEQQLQGKSSADPDMKQTQHNKQIGVLDQTVALFHAKQVGRDEGKEVFDPTGGAAAEADACSAASMIHLQHSDKAAVGAASASCLNIR